MLDSTKTLNGSFGKMFSADGTWLSNVNRIEAGGEVSKEEINRSGTRVKGHKVVSVTFSGTFTGYKVTTAMAREIMRIKDSGASSLVTQLVYKLDDPDGDEKIWVRLKGVQFDNIPIINAEAGTIVTEELPFTFTDFEYL